MRGRLPSWFTKRLPDPRQISHTTVTLKEWNLNTICESALCPNIGDCFSQKTATFLILGRVCTRDCTFCAVRKGRPEEVDPSEAERISWAASELGLHYVVITSVTRDDLPDLGSGQFRAVIGLLKKDGFAVEALIPDFCGERWALEKMLEASPNVVAHNVETVPRLYGQLRRSADYERSLRLLSWVKHIEPTVVTKSGLMLGLGERFDEVVQVLEDLRTAGCEIVTMGQYLPPSKSHHPVFRFVSPEEFEEYGRIAKEMGFLAVASAPLVRSSFRASDLLEASRDERRRKTGERP
jgi:lipoic acid synthetase